nr:drebrin-like protein [Onthophagus taurus]
MFTKLTTLACVLAVANCAWNGPLAGGAPASSVPAGISEAACPNYPHCTNPSVAVEPNSPAQPQSQYQQYQPQYQQPQYQSHQPQYQPQQQYQSQPQQQYQPQPQYQSQPQQYQPQPQQYQQQPQQNQYNSGNHNENVLLSGEYTGDGDYRGEGLAESGAFGPVDDPKSYDATPAPQMAYQPTPAYNPAGYQQQGYNNAPQHAQPNNVPAGLDPSYCPNYPFCH